MTDRFDHAHAVMTLPGGLLWVMAWVEGGTVRK